MKEFGSWSELVSIIFREDSQAITLRPNQSTTYTASRDIQLPPGDTDHALVSATSVAAFTNKTYDADASGNSLTNVDDGNIKAGAAINATKIHDGSVDNTEFGYLNGVTSAIQTQIDGKVSGPGSATDNAVVRFDGTTGKLVKNSTVTMDGSGVIAGATIDGDDNTVQDLPITSIKTVLADANKVLRRDASGVPQSGNTIPNTSALVTIDASQVITGKDVDGGTATDSSRITLPKETTANLNALTRKQGTVVYDTTTNEVKFDNGTTLSALASSAFTAPSIQKFTSGSGTYTTPGGVLWIRVSMVGGGGGGAGSGTAAGTAATSGGNTTFGTSLLTAAGGTLCAFASNGGAGGAATINSPAVGTGITGGSGSGYGAHGATPVGIVGGAGGMNALGSAGGGGAFGFAGSAAATNSGGGGGGGGTDGATANSSSGGGGGAGAYIQAIITSPSATYSYAVGAAGSGAGAGSNGFAGGNGGSGYIIVEEFRQ